MCDSTLPLAAHAIAKSSGGTKKNVAAVVTVLVAGIGVGVFWLSGDIEGLIKGAIEKYGSAITRSTVSVGAVNIAPTDGKGTISDLTVGNPAGVTTASAVARWTWLTAS